MQHSAFPIPSEWDCVRSRLHGVYHTYIMVEIMRTQCSSISPNLNANVGLIPVCPNRVKQWLLLTEAVLFVYWRHNGKADTGTLVESADVPGSALPLSADVPGSALSLSVDVPGSFLPLWHQLTNCTASVGSNHCFQAFVT